MVDSKFDEKTIRREVRDNYAEIARVGDSGCGCSSSCGAETVALTPEATSRLLGYSEEDLASLPEGANLGLGCGNPFAVADLREGEVVLDLGSGAGIDCFLAARKVGREGRVIGVDMTPEMIDRARENAAAAGADNVEFRLGEIEHLPVADGVVDVIISNCVINLSPDKRAVFREAYRVLKPGGRLAVSDVVASAPLPEEVRSDLRLYSACVAGAEELGVLESLLGEIGFVDVRIEPVDESRDFIREWAPGRKVEEFVVSSFIRAVRPRPTA